MKRMLGGNGNQASVLHFIQAGGYFIRATFENLVVKIFLHTFVVAKETMGLCDSLAV